MENSEPYIQKAVVNGLIATVILWGFWTPFILVLVIGLVNNQIKDGICDAAVQVSYNSYAIENQVADEISDYTKIPENEIFAWIDQLLRSSGRASQDIINEDPTTISADNRNLAIAMIVTCIFIIIASIGLAYYIVEKYNLNGWAIFRFNIVMAVIIMIIEGAFFGGVAMQFIPFYPSDILSNLADRINEYVKAMTGA